MADAAAKSDPAPEAAAAAAAAAAPAVSAGGLKAWLPTIVALVLAPAACWSVAQFVLLPQLKQSLLADVAAEGELVGGGEAATVQGEAGAKGAHGAKEGELAAAPSYKFENVVVNLAGTMGTRYLKTTFIVTGAAADIQTRFEASRPQLLDVTIGVLSSLTLTDLEQAGAKNVLREKLVNAYNQALGQRVAEQVYFADFVVQ